MIVEVPDLHRSVEFYRDVLGFKQGGMADLFYFYDPDRHNLELRLYA